MLRRKRSSLGELSSARFVLAAVAAVTIFSVFYQQRWGTIADTSWLITVCERVLAGERLYVDLIETNPPFSVWLYMPPVALANALGVRTGDSGSRLDLSRGDYRPCLRGRHRPPCAVSRKRRLSSVSRRSFMPSS